MKRKMLVAAMAIGALLLVFSLQGCVSNQPSGGGGGGGSNSVSIKDFAYHPENITVSKGTTITWTNDEQGIYAEDHTVTSDQGVSPAFDSGTIKHGGGTYTHTFNDTGTFPYHCTPHPYMHGNVTVM